MFVLIFGSLGHSSDSFGLFDGEFLPGWVWGKYSTDSGEQMGFAQDFYNPQYETLLDIACCLCHLCVKPHDSQFCDSGFRLMIGASSKHVSCTCMIPNVSSVNTGYVYLAILTSYAQ